MERMTQKNPDGVTFRVPLQRGGEFRVMSEKAAQAVFGDIVNRLGEYEECLTIAEAKRMRRNG